MSLVIIVFGALTLIAGLVILVNPDTIFGVLQKNIARIELHILAVVLRLALGALLIQLSAVSRFPLAIEIIGWLSIVAATVFMVIGRNNFIRLMTYAMSLQKPFGRVGGFFAMCFGGFLIYAFV